MPVDCPQWLFTICYRNRIGNRIRISRSRSIRYRQSSAPTHQCSIGVSSRQKRIVCVVSGDGADTANAAAGGAVGGGGGGSGSCHIFETPGRGASVQFSSVCPFVHVQIVWLLA
jgi:hypothetical protein